MIRSLFLFLAGIVAGAIVILERDRARQEDTARATRAAGLSRIRRGGQHV